MIDGNNLYKSAHEYVTRAEILFNEGKYKRAIRIYNQAILLVPNQTEALFHRGLAKYHSGDQKGAMNDFERIGELGSNLADIFTINAKSGKIP